mmetsp:Transcript_17788/g.36814  ORF Transcript_17788/g.36814 Transcript_17788/m.36814 type:complete len:334 (-) Transcript_17788:374-1375(-)
MTKGFQGTHGILGHLKIAQNNAHGVIAQIFVLLNFGHKRRVIVYFFPNNIGFTNQILQNVHVTAGDHHIAVFVESLHRLFVCFGFFLNGSWILKKIVLGLFGKLLDQTAQADRDFSKNTNINGVIGIVGHGIQGRLVLTTLCDSFHDHIVIHKIQRRIVRQAPKADAHPRRDATTHKIPLGVGGRPRHGGATINDHGRFAIIMHGRGQIGTAIHPHFVVHAIPANEILGLEANDATGNATKQLGNFLQSLFVGHHHVNLKVGDALFGNVFHEIFQCLFLLKLGPTNNFKGFGGQIFGQGLTFPFFARFHGCSFPKQRRIIIIFVTLMQGPMIS